MVLFYLANDYVGVLRPYRFLPEEEGAGGWFCPVRGKIAGDGRTFFYEEGKYYAWKLALFERDGSCWIEFLSIKG